MPVIVRVIVAVLVVRVIMRMIVLMVVAVMGVRMLVRRVVATAGVVMRMGVVAIGMLVAVIMAVVVVIVPVVMMVMPVMLVGVSLVRVGVFGRFIGACVWLEGRLDMRNLRAEPAHHVFQHVVAAHANAVGEDFGLRVPVADVIGHARKLPRIGAAHLGQFFRRSDDLDQPAVFQNQRVAAPQRQRLRQIQQKLGAPRAPSSPRAAMASLVVKDDGVGRGRLPGPLVADEVRADHVSSLSMAQASHLPFQYVGPGAKARDFGQVNT